MNVAIALITLIGVTTVILLYFKNREVCYLEDENYELLDEINTMKDKLRILEGSCNSEFISTAFIEWLYVRLSIIKNNTILNLKYYTIPINDDYENMDLLINNLLEKCEKYHPVEHNCMKEITDSFAEICEFLYLKK